MGWVLSSYYLEATAGMFKSFLASATATDVIGANIKMIVFWKEVEHVFRCAWQFDGLVSPRYA